MTLRSILPVGLLALGLLVQPTWSLTLDQSVPPPESAVRQPDQLSLSIQAIEQAPDPSAAVAAYARGVALDPSNPNLLEVYVNRMVDFGLPEVAYRQAQVLVAMDPNNGQAWAVLSYASARRGQMAEAFADLVQAANREPDNKFIQSTAGELLAWYDRNKATVPDSLKGSLEKIRRQMAGQKAYADAYQQATGELAQSPGTQQQRAQPAPQQQYGGSYLPVPSFSDSGVDYGAAYAPYSLLSPDAINYPGYYPYYSSSYYPPYCYPSYAYGWGWPYSFGDGWWPYGPFCGSGFFFGFNNRFFHRDDFFFHDRFFTHRFDSDDFHHHSGFDRFNHGISDSGRFDRGQGFFADRGRGALAFDGGRSSRDSGIFGSRRDVSRATLSQQGRNNQALSERLGLTARGVDSHNAFRGDTFGSRSFRSGANGRMQTNISRPLTSTSNSNAVAMRGFTGSRNLGGASRSFNASRSFSASRGPSLGASRLSSRSMGGSRFSAPSRSFGGGATMRSFGGSSAMRSFGSSGFRGGGAPARSFSGGGSGGGGLRGGGFGGGSHGGGGGGRGGGGHR